MCLGSSTMAVCIHHQTLKGPRTKGLKTTRRILQVTPPMVESRIFSLGFAGWIFSVRLTNGGLPVWPVASPKGWVLTRELSGAVLLCWGCLVASASSCIYWPGYFCRISRTAFILRIWCVVVRRDARWSLCASSWRCGSSSRFLVAFRLATWVSECGMFLVSLTGCMQPFRGYSGLLSVWWSYISFTELIFRTDNSRSLEQVSCHSGQNLAVPRRSSP